MKPSLGPSPSPWRRCSLFRPVLTVVASALLVSTIVVLVVTSQYINSITNNTSGSNNSTNNDDNQNNSFRRSSPATVIVQHPYSDEIDSGGLVVPESAASNNDDDDPCLSASKIMGTGGDVGVMYVIAGDTDYAATFIPVVGYLRDTLKIPNASERQHRQQTQSSSHYSPQLKYALVTEPHLCRDVFKDIVSFFDVVVTIASKKDPPMVQQTAHLLMPDLFQNPFLRQQKKKPKAKVMKEHGPNVMGNVVDPYQQQKSVLFWSKAIKIVAMATVSPFKVTIFNDADNIPLQADYDHQMLRQYNISLLPGGRAGPGPAGGTTGSPFDIASMPMFHRRGKGTESRGPTTIEAWLNTDNWVNVLEAKPGESWKRINKNHKSPVNIHNTRTVLLNMTSSRTRTFLDRYKYEHMYALVDQDLPVMDQPSFGKAALSMHLDYGDKWKHLDLEPHHFCGKDYNQSSSRHNQCIFVHKYKAQ